MKTTISLDATDGAARAGRVHTARGTFVTPCFMPVGTRGAVRHLSAGDLELLGADVMLGNTYHLMLRPGVDTIAALGGLHHFTDWDGHILTDSGGYQIFSLAPKVDDDGAVFRSVYDGSSHRLTPEGAVDVQRGLGADIQMVLDVCPPAKAPPAVMRTAVDRTAMWAQRARRQFVIDESAAQRQSQFGIVQGGLDLALRTESAERTIEIGFDGYAVGGLSVGERRDEMLPPLATVAAMLPPDQPRYFMGLGDPIGMVEVVALGVDMFDCVLPTRLARHGTLLTAAGRLNIKRAEFARSDDPLDPALPASPVARYSRGYLRHLLSVDEPTAGRLLTLHNLAWVFDFVARMRRAIVEGRFEAFRRDVHEVWAAS
ncbi:MAG: tRNA guanosine(34) transglycosylase Tgt [Acidimicrobiales bacterium]